MHQLSPIMKILSFRYPRKLNGRKSREAQKLRRADPIGLILNRLLEKQKGQEDPGDISNLLKGRREVKIGLTINRAATNSILKRICCNRMMVAMFADVEAAICPHIFSTYPTVQEHDTKEGAKRQSRVQSQYLRKF